MTRLPRGGVTDDVAAILRQARPMGRSPHQFAATVAARYAVGMLGDNLKAALDRCGAIWNRRPSRLNTEGLDLRFPSGRPHARPGSVATAERRPSNDRQGPIEEPYKTRMAYKAPIEPKDVEAVDDYLISIRDANYAGAPRVALLVKHQQRSHRRRTEQTERRHPEACLGPPICGRYAPR
jgi:hypothetical protein